LNQEVEEKLAGSLTAITTDLLPFLPYLLQDFWELGSSPTDIKYLIKKHVSNYTSADILDLACGKGAVSINLASDLNANVLGVDLMPDFIIEAKRKAIEWDVAENCQFIMADINEIIMEEKEYDVVIFGAAADILGTPDETLKKLKKKIRPDGYIIIDEAYLPDNSTNDSIQYRNYDYLPRQHWLKLFQDNQLKLLEELPDHGETNIEEEKQFLIKRVNELIEKYPEKRDLFLSYKDSQLREYEDLDSHIIAVTWILQSINVPTLSKDHSD
jgi:ubiquinone/menaquinone biosynthesis C-methylase UbiE